jgi:hypothetical protein
VGLEREVALLIVSPDAAAVADQVADLTAVAGFALTPGPTHEMHDLSLDTPGGLLAARRLSLRIRAIDTEQVVTLKGPARATPWGGVERLEMEDRWALTGWFVVDVLRSLGFGVVQSRETRRRLRRLTRPDDSTDYPLAEFAVDAVTFRLRDRCVTLHAIELEVKESAAVDAVAAAAAWLRARYGDVLRPWPYGKLATGRAIDALLAGGVLDPVLDANGAATPAAIDRIDAWLSAGRG